MFRSVALGLTLALAAISAHGATVYVVASGALTEFFDPQGLLPSDAPPFNPPLDSAVTVRFTYDSGTPDSRPEQNVGEFRGAISDLSLSIGFYTVPALAANLIAVVDGDPTPPFGSGDVWVADSYTETPLLRTSISLMLVNANGNAFASDALIEPSYDYGFSVITYEISDRSDPTQPVTLARAQAFLFGGSIEVTSVPTPTVPAPATGWLLVTALAGLGGRWWQRRNVVA